MEKSLTKAAERSLGSSASYAVYTDKFDASLLNPLPRAAGRADWGIDASTFSGVDVWHCHEASFLLDSGKPVSGVLKFIYDCQSEYMIESKSMKLYLNTFDMCKMGKERYDASQNYTAQVKKDLERVLDTRVDVAFHAGKSPNLPYSVKFTDGQYLDSVVIDSAPFTEYSGSVNLLKLREERASDYDDQYFWTNSLRSRCRVTKQKDTGSAYISLYHPQKVDPASVLRQIVSLRESAEFHELCADILMQKFLALKPYHLAIALLYNRRGSLDINPVRWYNQTPWEYPFNHNLVYRSNKIHTPTQSFHGLTDVGTLTQGAPGQ